MRIKIEGYGIQTFAGTVPFAAYEYFESEGIDLEDYENPLTGDPEDIIYELPSPTAILMGRQVLEGLIFGEEFEANSDFDLKQLEIYYHNNGDDLIVKSIQYAEQELHNTWLEVEVESNEYEWITK